MWCISSFLTRWKRVPLPGYGLIEIAIVLVIVGIMAGYGLPMLSGMHQNAKNQVTHRHQEQVKHVIAGYVLINGKFPLPRSFKSPAEKESILIGFIPHKDLGIPLDLTKDGFGNHMVYVVAKCLTETRHAPIGAFANMEIASGVEEEGNNQIREESTTNDPVHSENITNSLLGDEGDDEVLTSNPKQTITTGNTAQSSIAKAIKNDICNASSPIILMDASNRPVYNKIHNTPFLVIGFAQSSLGPTLGKGVDWQAHSFLEQENLKPSGNFHVRPVSLKGEVVFRQIISHMSVRHLMVAYGKGCK